MHHYFTHYGLGEKRIVIHADNCSGQNKNNAMIKYLMWRIENGLHNKITYSFMVAGHTKFSPDGFFGLFKLKLRNSEVENLEDLVKVVEKSSIEGYNTAQTIFNGSGTREVHFYKWTEFLNQFYNNIKDISKQHHFSLSADNIGVIELKHEINGDMTTINIMKKDKPSVISSFPKEIVAKGLSAERQWYLYEQIREHVHDPSKKDEFCYKPQVPKPKKNHN